MNFNLRFLWTTLNNAITFRDSQALDITRMYMYFLLFSEFEFMYAALNVS